MSCQRRRRNGRRSRLGFIIVSLSILLATSAIVPSAVGSSVGRKAPVNVDRSMTVILQNDIFESLDPSTNQFASMGNPFFNEIFGSLFYEKPNGRVATNIATSYKFTDNSKVFTFTVRPGIKFTDGTPLNAAAVVYNIKRDIKNGCITYGTCDGLFRRVTSVSSRGADTVVLRLSKPTPTLLAAFVNTPPDWIGSPTAIKREGAAKFGEHPVGAGPYEVTSFSPDSKVVIVRNPHYYKSGLPYIKKYTFLNASVDQSSYSALESGSAQVVVGVTTPSIIAQAKKHYHVLLVNNPTEDVLNLNTAAPPFNNPTAREAVAYAANQARIVQLNSRGLGKATEGVMGPGGYGFEAKVPGFRKHNLKKAEALVKKLGGLSFTIIGGQAPYQVALLSSLESTLAQAGIKVTLKEDSIPQLKEALLHGHWNAQTAVLGGVDPDVGSFSFENYLESSGIYSCCHSPKLNAMIERSIAMPDSPSRIKLIHQIAAHVIGRKQDIVPLYSAPEVIIASKSVAGLTAAPAVLPTIMTMPLTSVHYK